MENGGGGLVLANGMGETEGRRWRFKPNETLAAVNQQSIRGVLDIVGSNLNGEDGRDVIQLGHGDPSAFESFRTTSTAEDALVESIRSGKFNRYPPSIGLPAARRAVSEYLSKDLPFKLSHDDVFLTVGCAQAIEVVLHVLSRPGANILLPRPGFPLYEARTTLCGLEARHFDLLPDQHWEIDLQAVESLADENTVAMVIINPVNPCGNVFSREHLEKVAGVARKLGIVVIADEVYAHLNFGSKPFVPMGAFSSIVPVITLGSISKRWVVPGWRLGWLATCDPNGILKQNKIVDGVRSYLNVSSDPATIIQAALPKILGETTKDFFNKTVQTLKLTADICYNALLQIDCISCPHRPEASMFVMVRLDASRLKNIKDDMDFCCKLAREESIIVLPGSALGMKGWLRITFAVDPPLLQDGLARMRSFCHRHKKN
ncbi:Tyrosine aminotransferase [Nymphaea thermarum]|nr:Tyrosine aminotransferase [Nymphaea thermarum]